jgi:hypothetical protein
MFGICGIGGIAGWLGIAGCLGSVGVSFPGCAEASTTAETTAAPIVA